MISDIEIKELFTFAQEHQKDHHCGAVPYENGEKLAEALVNFEPKQILEIGTGIGYSAVLMAKALPGAHIVTLEKDSEHASLARDFFRAQRVIGQIELIGEQAEDYLPNTNPQFDFIFFDGYQIHYEFLAQYHRLLRKNGILFLANNHLQSKSSEQFFRELQPPTWKVLDKFADTTIAQFISFS